MKFSVNANEAYAYTGGKPFDASLPCVVFIHPASTTHFRMDDAALASAGITPGTIRLT